MTNPIDPENEQPPAAGAEPQYQPPQYAPPSPYTPPQAPQPQVPPGWGQQYQSPQYSSAPPQVPQYAPYAPYPYPPLPGPGEPFNGAVDPDDLSRPLYGASFGQAVRRFFKSYAKFSGRASRSEYWWSRVFLIILFAAPWLLYMVGAVALGIGGALSDDGSASGTVAAGFGGVLMVLGGLLLLVVFCGTIIPSLAITWRRLHDADLAGPFYFLSLIPVGDIVVLVFTILGSKPSGRRFDS